MKRKVFGFAAALWMALFCSVASGNPVERGCALDVVGQGEQAARVCEQAYFPGRWFPIVSGGHLAMTATHGGSFFRSTVSKTKTLTGVFAKRPGSTMSARLAVYVAETGKPLARSRYVDIDYTDNAPSYVLLDGLDPEKSYAIEVWVAGVDQYPDRWTFGSGVTVERLEGDVGASISPWEDARKQVLFIGDSMVEGLSAKTGQGSIVKNGAGDEAFGTVASRILGMSPINNGYGGVGLLASGSGGWPPAATSFKYLMKGRPVSSEAPEVVVIALGTNDNDGNYDDEFEPAYERFLADIKTRYPTSKVIAMIPFAQPQAKAITSAAAAVGVPIIKTAGWNISTTDGVHPDNTPEGHQRAGRKTAEAIQAILSNKKSWLGF